MVKIYFATNRNPNNHRNPSKYSGEFNSKAVDNLRFGKADVAGNKIRSITTAPEKLDPSDEKTVLGSTEIFGELKRAMIRGMDTVVFVHGYNVSFEEALIAAGRLRRQYKGRNGINVVLFSWPSDGSMMPLLAYKRDRTDARVSAPAFARGLAKLQEFLEEVRRGKECNSRLHLMCHSMGNYVLRNGLQAITRGPAGPPRIFDEIFLFAADEDHDAFEKGHKFLPLPELGKSVHVYFNRGDTALVISDKTKSNPTRLGSRGPRSPLTVPGNVTIVDCSEVVTGLVEHSYFLEDRQVLRDVRAVLRGLPADKVARRRYVPSQNKYVVLK